MKDTPDTSNRLLRSLSPLAVWALSFGCSVGWGAFVMPGTTYLPIAGPLGSAIGIVAGALVMLIIGVNYHYLMNRYPDAGGTFAYSAKVFGYDHGFLSAWFMGLVYLAIIWANATALPLIFRSIFGDLLRFGFHYVIAGYDIYMGEILLSLISELLFCFVCLRGNKVSARVQTVLALLLILGVAAALAAVFLPKDGQATPNLQPLFSPDNSRIRGTVLIVFLAPWAYAGFESVSHSAEEFRFSHKKTLRIMTIALITSAAAYIGLVLIAASAQPKGSSDWPSYVRDLEQYGGIEGSPVFYGIYRALGNVGLTILGVAAACGIITGLIGNMTAASRMIYAMARDDMLPGVMGKLNKRGVPQNAVLLLLLVSLPIPFLGRSAIGWIVDVNTIGVTVAYAYTSCAALMEAVRERKSSMEACGSLGVLISVFFLLYFLVPGLSSVSSLSAESYLMLLAWCILGFVVFYFLFNRDKFRRMGKSTTVWVVLLLLIFATSMIWIVGSTRETTANAVEELNEFYAEAHTEHSLNASEEELRVFNDTVRQHFSAVSGSIIRNTVIQFAMILLALLIIFHIYSTVRKRGQTAVQEKNIAEQSSQSKSTFLSNMSHDIRTPMNAIIGYVTLAKREKGLTPRVANYLEKIEASSDHLLALINDVLEMSRIESGRMELAPVPTDLRKLMEEVQDLFSTQMREKGLSYTAECRDLTDSRVLCDKNRMNRVLLNLVSNAYKFTPEGGSVTVTLTQTGREENMAAYRLSVKDTGIGMSPEFAAKVFEAYEREKTQTVENIQGTGLGTAITKSIVELMGGSIQVFSEQGKGSEFVIDVSLPVEAAPEGISALSEEDRVNAAEFRGLRLLLVEDDPENLEVEQTLLEEAGFLVDAAENGEDGVELLAASGPGHYAAVLMDIEMPVKNGYDSAKLIRSLRNPELAGVPIIALTAKAFSEDIAAAREAGMNGHIAKPINMKTVLETLNEVLSERK